LVLAGNPGSDPDLYKKRSSAGTKQMAGRVLSLVFSQIFLKSFSLTFLAEWGDRSQIATIGWVRPGCCCWATGAFH
jgi:putative Ca2+/H+ antiporter (TMEM165/GDT1 family)